MFHIFKSAVLVFVVAISSTYAGINDEIASIRAKDANTIQEKLDVYNDAFLLTRSIGEELVNKIYNDEVIYGHHVILIHEALALFVEKSQELFDIHKDLESSHKFLWDNENAVNNSLEQILVQTVLTNNINDIHALYYEVKQLRRIVLNQTRTLNFEISDFNKLAKFAKSRKNKKSLSKKLKIYTEFKQANESFSSPLEATAIYSDYLADGKIDELKNPAGFFARLGDRLQNGISAVLRGVSRLYGSIAGNIKWRKGYLRNNQELVDTIKSRLKPLDLIFEKRAFVLTDKSIPGNWGHASIWLGTESELKALGIWDHPVLKPFQADISAGKSVYEVRRWGLQFTDLESSMNLDQFSAIRVTDILQQSPEQLIGIYKLLFDQIGKKYDFLFDAMTTDRVTCTEIVAFSYGPINWPMEYILARYTITPNNLAELAIFENSPVEFVTYYIGDENGPKEHGIVEFAKRMGYEHNQEKSSQGLPYFEKLIKKCRTFIKDGKERVVCMQEAYHPVYTAPELRL